MKSYAAFKLAIAISESSGSYTCVNRLGYLGRYQFGLARLCDLGLTRRKDPKAKSCANADFVWIPPVNESTFLRDATLQEKCFDRHVQDLKRQITGFYECDNMSGAVAACHLVGREAFEEWIKNGKEACDANGVSAAVYFERFRGFEIP